jgi:glutathione synthase
MPLLTGLLSDLQVVGQGDGKEDVSIVHAPFALAPTPFPQLEFELVQRSMPLFSSLVHAVSQDGRYLARTLAAAAKHDDFTSRLLGVWRESAELRAQFGTSVVLGLHRSDYMLDEPSASLLQVELNTIASSFGSLSTRVSELHRYLLTLHPTLSDVDVSQLPEQRALQGFAAAIALAHNENCKAQKLGADAVVVMVVQPGERNAFDQQWLQVALWQEHGVRVARRTLTEIATTSSTNGSGTMRCGLLIAVLIVQCMDEQWM